MWLRKIAWDVSTTASNATACGTRSTSLRPGLSEGPGLTALEPLDYLASLVRTDLLGNIDSCGHKGVLTGNKAGLVPESFAMGTSPRMRCGSSSTSIGRWGTAARQQLSRCAWTSGWLGQPPRRANQSDRAKKALEEKLSNEPEQHEMWEAWLQEKKNSIHSLRRQLLEETERCKTSVAQLQAEVAPTPALVPSAPVTLQDILDGKQLFDAGTVESFFNVDPEVYELGDEDEKQFAKRARDLSKARAGATQSLFGSAARQLEKAKNLHKRHVSGFAKRRGNAEGKSTAGGGDAGGGQGSAGAAAAAEPAAPAGGGESADSPETAARSSDLIARAEAALGAGFQPSADQAMHPAPAA